MRVIALKSPRTLYGLHGPFFLLNIPLYRGDLKLPEIMQSASHLYNGAALFARKDRVSGNIIFNRLTHRQTRNMRQTITWGGRGPSQQCDARNGQYIPSE